MTSTAPGTDTTELLESAQAMGALPVTVSQLATLVADDDYAIADVVGVVSLDQSLVAALLRQANSAASAPVSPVTTVRDAAVRLGVGSLLSLALAASVSDRMTRALPAYALSEGALWQESVAASVAAEVLRVKATVPVPAEASTAALLHDLGKVVLSAHLGPAVLDLLAGVAQGDGQADRLLAAETELLGMDHAQVGGLVAEHWGLPDTIVAAICEHHRTDPDLGPVSATVSLAHAMVGHVLLDDATGRVPSVPLAHRSLMRALGVDPATYPELVAAARARYVGLAERYGVRSAEAGG